MEVGRLTVDLLRTTVVILLFLSKEAKSECFGGVLTFEKSTGFVSTGNKGVQLSTYPQPSTVDCIGLCRNNIKCKAFTVDYEGTYCQSYTEDSISNRQLLSEQKRSNYFEKLCLNVNNTYFSMMCGQKQWAFERVTEAVLEVTSVKKQPVSSRAECMRLCLTETEFNCRAANYDTRAQICHLLQEDRRLQPNSFRRLPGSDFDYLENQCSVRVIQSCIFKAKRDAMIPNPDQLVGALTQKACESECDTAQTFFCRSFAFEASSQRCYLSGDDKITLGSEPIFQPGIVSGERACALIQCPGNSVTYEKVTGRYISGAKEDELPVDSRLFSTAECLRVCTNSNNCPAIHMDYEMRKCYKLDRNSQDSRTLFPEKQGTSYFERICLPSAARYCAGKAWSFVRVPGFELRPDPMDRVVQGVQSRRICQSECMMAREVGFICRSAVYDSYTAICRLSMEDRRSNPQRFVKAMSITAEYLENLCAPPNPCGFQREDDFFPLYTDVSILQVMSAEQCQLLCESNSDFVCRAYGFRSGASECRLSADDKASGQLISHRGAIYAERRCSANLVDPEGPPGTSGGGGTPGTGSNPGTFPSGEPGTDTGSGTFPSGPGTSPGSGPGGTPPFPTVFPSRGGRCTPGSPGNLAFERTTGYTLVSGQVLYRGLASGVLGECRKRCVIDTECASFSVDFATATCYSTVSLDPKDNRDSLSQTVGTSYFESVCYRAVKPCNHLWVFERHLNKDLQGADRDTYNGISRAECEEKCLMERRFVCRSASYSPVTQECRLSDHNRYSRQDNLKDSQTFDYLENSCALSHTIKFAQGEPILERQETDPANCIFTNRQEGRMLNFNDRTITVSTETECQQECLREISFNCRSYSFITQGVGQNFCYLSGETIASTGAELQSLPGAVYAELVCEGTVIPPSRPPPGGPGTPGGPGGPGGPDGPGGPGGRPSPFPTPDGSSCSSPDEITFERIMGVIPHTSPQDVLELGSTSAPTTECLKECLRQGDTCLSVTVQYPGGAPYSTPCMSYSKRAGTDNSELGPRADSSYFEKICLRGRKCDVMWPFERVPGYVLVGFDNIQLRDVRTKEDCMEACQAETAFTCRSAEFYHLLKICHLSTETRRSQPRAFRYQGNDVHYLENQCAPDPSTCNFMNMENMYLPFADRMLPSTADLSECRLACSRETEFMCRSVNYDTRTNDCSLSSCDRWCNLFLRAPLIERSGTTYSEKSSCTPGGPFPVIPHPHQPHVRPQIHPNPPMFPFHFPVGPPMPHHTMPFPGSVHMFQRGNVARLLPTAERRQDNNNDVAKDVDEERCTVSQYSFLRITGMSPRSQSPTSLNVTQLTGTTTDCVNQCSRLGDDCRAFVQQAVAPSCASYKSAQTDLVRRDGVTYFEKICLQAPTCGKLWAFDVVIGFNLVVPKEHNVENVESRNKCAILCFTQKTIVCRSAVYIWRTKVCRMSEETRYTIHPKFFQYAGSDVLYMENQCA